MVKPPAFQFYPGDWLRDNIAGCSLAAQGLWLRMMFLMHDSERYGYLSMNGSPIPPSSLARRCSCDSETQYETLLVELDNAGVPSRTDKGVIFSRKMVRDEQRRKLFSSYGKKGGGNPALKGRYKPPINPPPEDEGEVENEVFCNREGIAKGMRTDGFPEAWRDYRAYRSEKGEAMNSYTAKQILIKCERMGVKKAVGAIRLGIEKGWKNLFEAHELQSSNKIPLAGTNGRSHLPSGPQKCTEDVAPLFPHKP